MKNYELYARILRLHHVPLTILRNAEDMKRIVVEVIYPDPDLVWC